MGIGPGHPHGACAARSVQRLFRHGAGRELAEETSRPPMRACWGLARAAKDQPAIDALTAIGPPPWDKVQVWPKYCKWQRLYQAKIATAPPQASQALSPAYASPPQEQVEGRSCGRFLVPAFLGPTLSGPFTQVDLPALGTDFCKDPDLHRPGRGRPDHDARNLARAYFDGHQGTAQAIPPHCPAPATNPRPCVAGTGFRC